MYLLEGNIGVGKSTFLNILTQHCPEITVIQEPVDNWSLNADGQSLLANFYQDPARWAYTLETFTMLARVRDHTLHQRQNNPLYIMERSVYSGHYCFALNGKAHGSFTPIEWEVYSGWVNFLVLKQCKPPRGFIYLQAAPEVCATRMKVRDRRGEEAVSLEYMQQIHDLHEKFMISREGIDARLASVPVLTLDVTQDLTQDAGRAADYAAQVRAFILEHAVPAGAQPVFSQQL